MTAAAVVTAAAAWVFVVLVVVVVVVVSSDVVLVVLAGLRTPLRQAGLELLIAGGGLAGGFESAGTDSACAGSLGAFLVPSTRCVRLSPLLSDATATAELERASSSSEFEPEGRLLI